MQGEVMNKMLLAGKSMNVCLMIGHDRCGDDF